MNRFLYVLLAASAFSGPLPAPVDVPDFEDKDAPGVVEGSHRARHASAGDGKGGIVVLPLGADDEELIQPQGVIDSLIVDRSDAQVAVIRSVGHDRSNGDTGPAHLLTTALRDAWHHGDLKVVIDLPLPFEHVAGICNANRFLYSRTVVRDGRRMHEFIADLYSAQLARLRRDTGQLS